MIGTYNNLKVKCDVYPYGDSVVDITDKNNSERSKVYKVNSVTHAAEYPGVINLHKDEKTNALIKYLKLKPLVDNGFINKITFHWYERDNEDGSFNYTEIDPKTLPFQDNEEGTFGDTSEGDNFIYTTRYVGAGIMQYDYQKTNDDAFDLVKFQENHDIKYNTAFAIYQNNAKNNNVLIPYPNLRMITFSGDSVIFDNNDKIVISGKFRMFPNTRGVPTVEPMYNAYIQEEFCNVECVLRYGDLYYTVNGWVKKRQDQELLRFRLPLEYKENTWMYNTDLSVKKNTISEDGEEVLINGYVIPAPPTSDYSRDFEFSICRPFACGYFSNERNYRFCGLTLISDF